MTTNKSSSKGVPPELAELADKLGIDPSLLSGSEPEDKSPPVYMGTIRAARPREEDSRFGRVRSGLGATADIRTSNQALLDFYAWDESKLLEFQQKAFGAGFYGTKDKRKVRFGDYDEETFGIWQQMVDRAAAFYANGTGKAITPWEAFEKALKIPSATEEDLEEPDSITLSNPEDLREAFRQVAIKKMGSRAGLDQVIERMVSAYQAAERGQQEQMFSASDDGVGNTITEMPSIGTFADRELRKADPTRYDARSAVDGFDMIANLMRGAEA